MRAVRAELLIQATTRPNRASGMLPLTIEMRDHLRQEDTGKLASPLPCLFIKRQVGAGLKFVSSSTGLACQG